MRNDFLGSVKPHFGFLSPERGYRLVTEVVSESFDDGYLIYESELLRIMVVRDRGQIIVKLRTPSGTVDLDEATVGLLLAGAASYPRDTPELPFTAEASSAFLRDNLTAIERLFDLDTAEDTIRRGRALMNERGEILFGRSGRAWSSGIGWSRFDRADGGDSRKRAIAALVVGAALGIACARFIFVGSALSLIPWAAAGIALGWWCGRRKWARTGAVYGFALSFTFMIAGYSGRASLASKLPAFALLGAFGALCGIGLSYVGSRFWLRGARRP